MCGRYSLLDLSDFLAMFPWVMPPEKFAPRYNIAPTQPILTLTNQRGGTLDHTLWGLIPNWAKPRDSAKPLINARCETVSEKPAFRGPFRHHRCIIPASGFYEWNARAGAKQPHYVTLDSGRPMLFAGLWEMTHDGAGGEIATSCIITTPANEAMRKVHDRMPAILSKEDAMRWVKAPDIEAADLLPLLKPSGEKLRLTPVGRFVNSPANDSSECIKAKVEEGRLFEW